MKRFVATSAVTLLAAAGIAAASAPAHASTTPALVDCPFGELFEEFDGTGSGSLGFATAGTELSVHEGNDDAWFLTVEEGFLAGQDGWMERDCVVFIA